MKNQKTLKFTDNRHWNTSFQSTKSGAGLQFLLLDCGARARRKGMFCSETTVGWDRITQIAVGSGPPERRLGRARAR